MVVETVNKPIVVGKVVFQPVDGGASLLFWGLIFVTVLNLGMIIGALVLFAP